MSGSPRGRHFFAAECEVARPLDEVFAWFSRPENLAALTPPSLKFRIRNELPTKLKVGSIIEIEIRPLGVPVRWSARILEWNPPHHFLDDQQRGPYAEWTHRHVFESVAGGTRIRDEIFYRLPLWPLGEVAHPIIRAQIGRIFDYRSAAILRILSSGSSTGGR